MMRLYTTLLRALQPVASIRAACARPGTAGRNEWDERLGRRSPSVAEGNLWIHGASLGEARIVTALTHALRAGESARPLAVSAFTPRPVAAVPRASHAVVIASSSGSGSQSIVGSSVASRVWMSVSRRSPSSMSATTAVTYSSCSVRTALGGLVDCGGDVEVVVANLEDPDAWTAAAAGCADIVHLASPVPVEQPKDANELIRPARDGALLVLAAAREAGVRRVVMTSSVAAISTSRSRADSRANPGRSEQRRCCSAVRHCVGCCTRKPRRSWCFQSWWAIRFPPFGCTPSGR